jgi:aspartate beta-hydroxylase
LVESLKQAQDLAVPYVAYEAGAPVNQWIDLNHSKRWSAVFFYKNATEYLDAHAQFPKTSAILKGLPLADIGGFCPNVMFSTLAPKSAIPPHTGETNARLVVHLPLIVGSIPAKVQNAT